MQKQKKIHIQQKCKNNENKKNIARIAKAALHKLPGKSSLNVVTTKTTMISMPIMMTIPTMMNMTTMMIISTMMISTMTTRMTISTRMTIQP